MRRMSEISPTQVLDENRTPVGEGPYNQLWAATCPRTKLKNGEYYEPVGIVGQRTTTASKDKKLAAQLWDWTEKALEGYN